MAAIGVVLEALLAGLVDSSGNPLAAGKLYSYESGTTTPKSLYTDQGLSSAAANPYTLGANGVAQLYASGTYKLVAKTAADVTVATWDALAFSPFEWQTWTPTLSVTNPFTFTSTSILFARYMQIQKLVIFMCSFSGTAGGTPGPVINVTMPVAGVVRGMTAAVQVTDGGVIVSGSATAGSATSLDIRRYNAANYTAGVVGPTIIGFYEAS